MPKNPCDQCGACCKGSSIVEADILDVLREPKLAKADPYCQGKSHNEVLRQILDDFGKAVTAAEGHGAS
jgi:hypothetical protein